MIVSDIWKNSNPNFPANQFNLARVSGTVMTILSAASAVLIVIVMRQITEWQSRPHPTADTTSPVV